MESWKSCQWPVFLSLEVAKRMVVKGRHNQTTEISGFQQAGLQGEQNAGYCPEAKTRYLDATAVGHRHASDHTAK